MRPDVDGSDGFPRFALLIEQTVRFESTLRLWLHTLVRCLQQAAPYA